jgi:hypothetical protein
MPSLEEKGEEFDLWRLSPPLDKPHVPVAMTKRDAVETVSRTMELIKKDGFCLWACHQLGGAVICVVPNTAASVPSGYPVYTFDELRMLSEANQWTQRMVLEAKRLLPGTVVVEPADIECVDEGCFSWKCES